MINPNEFKSNGIARNRFISERMREFFIEIQEINSYKKYYEEKNAEHYKIY